MSIRGQESNYKSSDVTSRSEPRGGNQKGSAVESVFKEWWTNTSTGNPSPDMIALTRSERRMMSTIQSLSFSLHFCSYISDYKWGNDPIHTRARIHTHTHSRARIYPHTVAHTYAHTHTRAHTHTHIRAHTHTHTITVAQNIQRIKPNNNRKRVHFEMSAVNVN